MSPFEYVVCHQNNEVCFEYLAKKATLYLPVEFYSGNEFLRIIYFHGRNLSTKVISS